MPPQNHLKRSASAHVIVADPDQLRADVVEAGLADMVASVTRCACPLDAIALAERRGFDLAIVALDAPAFPARRLLLRWRAREEARRQPITPIIGLAGAGEPLSRLPHVLAAPSRPSLRQLRAAVQRCLAVPAWSLAPRPMQ